VSFAEVGASAMNSAETRWALVLVRVVVNVSPVVTFFSERVKLPPAVPVTVAVNLSPGLTLMLWMVTERSGYISHQASCITRPPMVTAAVPICSTDGLPSPSSPTQNAASCSLSPCATVMLGSTHVAVTVEKAPPVTLWPDQLVLMEVVARPRAWPGWPMRQSTGR